MPCVSVIMPVYNAGKYLSEAVQSILDQTCADFELLAFDDGSTDNSAEILAAMAGRDTRVRVLGGEHRGLTHWLNTGIAVARGEFIARMDADDVALPTRLERQVRHMQAHPDCCLLGSQAFLIDAEGWPIGRWEVPLSHGDIDERHIGGKPGAVIHPAAMMRKSVLEAVNGYVPATELAEDYDLFMRLAERGKVANLPDYLLRYRLHDKSLTLSRTSAQYQVTCKVLADAWKRRAIAGTVPYEYRPKPVPKREDLLWRWAYTALSERHFRTARKYSLRLVAARPGRLNSWLLLAAATCGPLAIAMKDLVPFRPTWSQRD